MGSSEPEAGAIPTCAPWAPLGRPATSDLEAPLTLALPKPALTTGFKGMRFDAWVNSFGPSSKKAPW